MTSAPRVLGMECKWTWAANHSFILISTETRGDMRGQVGAGLPVDAFRVCDRSEGLLWVGADTRCPHAGVVQAKRTTMWEAALVGSISPNALGRTTSADCQTDGLRAPAPFSEMCRAHACNERN